MSSSKTNVAERLTQVASESELVVEQGNGAKRAGSLARLAVSAEAVRALPADFVKRHRVLPYDIRHGTIHVVTADPGNQRVIDDIRLLSGLEVQESEAP